MSLYKGIGSGYTDTSKLVMTAVPFAGLLKNR